MKNYFYLFSSYFIGAGSMLLFAAFIFLGPFLSISFGFSTTQALIFDAALSMIFFLQHSIIIRKDVRRKIEEYISPDYFNAFYSITSGIVLILMITMWQETYTVASATGAAYWLIRLLYIISIAGFYWGVKSLGLFDPFGTIKIKRLIKNKDPKELPLKVQGPYKWVRHPLYFFMLLMIWSMPNLTADRLLFNILWSTWIIFATMLEERDLVNEFGESYRSYQKETPMLFPWRIPIRS